MSQAVSPLDRRGARSASRGDERRAALLGALDTLLGEGRGLDTINVAEVSRRAGVSRSAFYFYFSSLPLAVAALSEQVYADAERATDLLLAAEGEPEVRLRRVITDLFDSVDAQRRVFRASLEARASNATVRELWATGRAGFAEQVARMIRAERRSGRAPSGPDAAALAAVLLDLNDRALESYVLGSGPPRGKHITALVAIWVRSIYGTDPEESR